MLTSFVGVTGLARRMSLDRCLPQFFLRENRSCKTNHWIILGFFAVCAGILLVTDGDIELLAGVYTLSFLGVMALFAIGNILLKRRRQRLPREERASWPGVILALAAVLVGLAGNLTPDNIRIFSLFLAGMGGFVAVMFLQAQLLRKGGRGHPRGSVRAAEDDRSHVSPAPDRLPGGQGGLRPGPDRALPPQAPGPRGGPADPVGGGG